MHIPKVLGTAFFYRSPVKKRKLMERLPLLQLACFMYIYKSLQAGQLPQEQPFFPRFIVLKYLKQDVDQDLSVYVDERSP